MRWSGKHTVLLAIIILLVLGGSSQAEFNPELVMVGAKIGVNVNSVSNHEKHTESRTGYTFGAMVNYKYTKTVSLQMELVIYGKGYIIPEVIQTLNEAPLQTDTLEGEVILGHLELPVLAKFRFEASPKYKPYVLGGGFFALSIDEKYRLTEGNGVSIDTDLDNGSSADVGLILGAGIDLKAGKGELFFETRYEMGFASPIKGRDYKLKSLSFIAGYWF